MIEEIDSGVYYRKTDSAGLLRRTWIAIVDCLVLIALGYALRPINDEGIEQENATDGTTSRLFWALCDEMK